jgi:hypothetical protein
VVIQPASVSLVEKHTSCPCVIWLKARRVSRDLHMKYNRGTMAISRRPLYTNFAHQSSNRETQIPKHRLKHEISLHPGTPRPGSCSVAQYGKRSTLESSGVSAIPNARRTSLHLFGTMKGCVHLGSWHRVPEPIFHRDEYGVEPKRGYERYNLRAANCIYAMAVSLASSFRDTPTCSPWLAILLVWYLQELCSRAGLWVLRVCPSCAVVELQLTSAALPNGNVTAVKCPSTAKFNTITAAAHFAGMNPGWNLGNTLDAVETVRATAPRRSMATDNMCRKGRGTTHRSWPQHSMTSRILASRASVCQ